MPYLWAIRSVFSFASSFSFLPFHSWANLHFINCRTGGEFAKARWAGPLRRVQLGTAAAAAFNCLLLPIRMLIFVFAFFLILYSLVVVANTQMREYSVIQLNCRIEFSSLLFFPSLSLSFFCLMEAVNLNSKKYRHRYVFLLPSSSWHNLLFEEAATAAAAVITQILGLCSTSLFINCPLDSWTLGFGRSWFGPATAAAHTHTLSHSLANIKLH